MKQTLKEQNWEDKLDKLGILSRGFVSYCEREVSVNYDDLKKFINALLKEEKKKWEKEIEKWVKRDENWTVKDLLKKLKE